MAARKKRRSGKRKTGKRKTGKRKAGKRKKRAGKKRGKKKRAKKSGQIPLKILEKRARKLNKIVEQRGGTPA